MTQQRTDEHCEALIATCCRAVARPPTFCSVMDGEIVATTSEVREICSDLLSLRAAVRRVLEAQDAIKDYKDYAIEHAREHPLALAEQAIEMRRVRSAEAAYKVALNALRAEMAGIDKDGGA